MKRRVQRGAVVIVAMLIVALAATAAALVLQQQDASVRQLQTAWDYEQACWVLRGGTHWARAILLQDARLSTIDHGGELWASGLPPTDIEQGVVAGDIADQQGLYNLNNLSREGKLSEHDVALLRRLLTGIGLAPELTDALAQAMRGRPPLQDLAELHGVSGFDEAAVSRLRRVATVLPRRTAVNVNTAPPEVLAALVDGLTPTEALVLAQSRQTAPIRTREEFHARLPRPELSAGPADISLDSSFFILHGRAQVGKADVRMEALLQREGKRMPAIVWERLL